VQVDEYFRDKDSFLGKMEVIKFEVPKVTVRKDYPYNGPWRSEPYGTDTSFKRTFIIEYPTKNKEQMEAIVEILKHNGNFKRMWGEHANLHFAPSKDENETSQTTLQRWHSICEAHNSTILSMGLVRFNDVINPDFKVEVKYLKTSRNKGEFMSLRDVLHSVSVPGSSKTVQVIHGICRAPDGGFEAAVADSIPFARTMAANMSSHLAGWISGYLKTKGWKQDSIKQLLRKSFTTQSIIAAENSTFNKHTGVVTSAAMDAVDRELLDLRDSWVDMSLGHGSVQENAAVNDDSAAAAFNWEDGASVGTMRSNVGDSDADSSVVYDDSDEVSDEEDDDEVGSREDGSDEGSNDEYASADDIEYEENEQEEDDMNEEESGSENAED
jgi:hypothetical protein